MYLGHFPPKKIFIRKCTFLQDFVFVFVVWGATPSSAGFTSGSEHREHSWQWSGDCRWCWEQIKVTCLQGSALPNPRALKVEQADNLRNKKVHNIWNVAWNVGCQGSWSKVSLIRNPSSHLHWEWEWVLQKRQNLACVYVNIYCSFTLKIGFVK